MGTPESWTKFILMFITVFVELRITIILIQEYNKLDNITVFMVGFTMFLLFIAICLKGLIYEEGSVLKTFILTTPALLLIIPVLMY